MLKTRTLLSLAAISALVLGCGTTARLPVSAGIGPDPQLPEPDPPLIPTVNIAPAVGWPDDRMPLTTTGMEVIKFAEGLDHPRWLYVLPNGDVLVAETAEPESSQSTFSISQWMQQRVKREAGAAVPSADRITLLRDSNGDGMADQQYLFIDHLHSPFGMVLVEDDLYVANTDELLRFDYETDQTRIEHAGERIVELPAGPVNYHWTKNVVASPDGDKLFVSVGSNSNIAERGIDEEVGRAAIWEIDRQSGEHRIFAHGLRNPVGMAWVPSTAELWTSVNERDELGGDLVPDYMTAVEDGGFYGWPFSYFGQHLDQRVEAESPALLAETIVPDYALGPHTSSMGLAYTNDDDSLQHFGSGMFVGQHGSWNREPRSGYKVIHVPFNNGRPSGMPEDVLTGFVNENGDAMGRPVGVAIDEQGDLLVADDVGNTVWRVKGNDTRGMPISAQNIWRVAAR